MKYLLALLLAISVAHADVIINIEEPSELVTSQGVGNIRGWAVADEKITDIDLYLDGEYIGKIPYGSTRLDVAAVFPEYPNSANSGFSMAFYFGVLDSDRPHTLSITAYSESGQEAGISSVTFDTTAFEEDDWYKDIETGYSSYEPVTDGFILYDIFLNENYYPEVHMRWENSTQGFVVIDVPEVIIGISCDEPRFSPDPLSQVCYED